MRIPMSRILLLEYERMGFRSWFQLIRVAPVSAGGPRHPWVVGATVVAALPPQAMDRQARTAVAAARHGTRPTRDEEGTPAYYEAGSRPHYPDF
jgi:hypothetical protein